jgi:hypothetical protein
VSESDPEVVEAIPVAGERRLVLRRAGGSDAITIYERNGTAAVTVVVTQGAITLSLGGANLEIEVERDLSITAQSLHLTGREAVAIATEGALSTTGRSQTITSTHGNVEVKANDDVKLEGERILLNC